MDVFMFFSELFKFGFSFLFDGKQLIACFIMTCDQLIYFYIYGSGRFVYGPLNNKKTEKRNRKNNVPHEILEMKVVFQALSKEKDH